MDAFMYFLLKVETSSYREKLLIELLQLNSIIKERPNIFSRPPITEYVSNMFQVGRYLTLTII